MEIKLNNVTPVGFEYDGKLKIEMPQEHGQGAKIQLVSVRRTDVENIGQLIIAGEKISLFGMTHKKKAPLIENCTFALVRENEPDPANNK